MTRTLCRVVRVRVCVCVCLCVWALSCFDCHASCDFRTVLRSELQVGEAEVGLQDLQDLQELRGDLPPRPGPLLLREFLQHWPDSADFLEKYANLTVQVGSESSIVQSHGSADSVLKLKDLLHSSQHHHQQHHHQQHQQHQHHHHQQHQQHQQHQHHQQQHQHQHHQQQRQHRSEVVSFDLDVLKKYPDLINTYSPPEIFAKMFSDDLMSSPVLSVGLIDSGLPLHTHGEAYLGLILGHKQWLIYPPGIGPSPSFQKKWNPFLPMSRWQAEFNEQNETIPRHRPLMCTQHPGDVIYVPSGWAHATLNTQIADAKEPEAKHNDRSGSTHALSMEGSETSESHVKEEATDNKGKNEPPVVVGIGMQKTWLAEQRELLSRAVLQNNPKDFEALKGVATSIFHRVFPAQHQSSELVGVNSEVDMALDEAVKCLRMAIEVRPKFSEVRNLLVIILFRRGDDYRSAAIREMKALEALLDTLTQDREKELLSSGRSDVAPDNAVASARGLASAYFRLSLPLSTKDLDQEALALLQKSIRLDPTVPKVHAQRMLLFQKSGMYSSALEALQEMDSLTPLDDWRGRQRLHQMRLFLMKKINAQTVAHDDL